VTPKPTVYPAWVKCPNCDDFWCSIHHMHAYDCECPSIDTWIRVRKIDPYLAGGRPLDRTQR
jgi:hypothetical protein